MRLSLMLLVLLGACASRVADEPRAYVVFFTKFSAELDDAARGVVANAASRANRHPEEPVIVSGFAGPQGPPGPNQALSGKRAQVVADLLAADGVAASRIRPEARGQVDYTLDPIESRRVEIVFVPR